MDENIEAFVIHILSFSFSLTIIHMPKKAYMALFSNKKIIILSKYWDFSNIF